MRGGHFSIEWMAQSSTRVESLPGFGGGGRTGRADVASRQTRKHGPEADSAGGAEEETSGYESERSPPPPSRRPRTAFTAEQIVSLERAFERNAYLAAQDKAALCEKLRLSDKQIRNWFQNRRMKLKRTAQDALAQACRAGAASHFARHPAELRAYRPPPYGAAFALPLRDVAYAPVASPLDGLLLAGAAPPPSAAFVGSYPAYPQYY